MSGTTITSSSTSGYYLGPATVNPVTVAAGVIISQTSDPALGSQLSTDWTIVNYGTLLATEQNTASNGVMLLGGGGAITNTSSGSITGVYAGVSVAGSGTVINQGSITSSNTIGAGFTYTSGGFTANTAGVLLGGGGVYNGPSGFITSYLEGVAVGSGGSVENAGSILAVGTKDGIGVVLPAGGSVINDQNATIRAGLDSVLTFGTASTVINQGVLYALDGVGVGLIAGGVVSNASTGRIDGYSFGVLAQGSAASTVTNSGILYGYAFAGALLDVGGSVTNATGGDIEGRYFGIEVSSGTGTMLNMGTISASATFSSTATSFASAGVQLADGGVVTNAAGGQITSEWMGVQIGQSPTASIGGTVMNAGTIRAADANGDGAGIWLHGPGSITNAAGGVISGGAFGIVAYYQTTVVNQGTIFGTQTAFDAVRPGFANRVIDLPGGVFQGAVNGGNTLGSAVYSTVELASGSSTGTIENISTFTGFGQIALDGGATWSVGGSIVAGETIGFSGSYASLILTSPSAAAGTITNFAASDTIALSGITDVTGLSFDSGNTLTVSESGAAGLTLVFDAPLDLTYAAANGATDITLVPCFLPGTHILTDVGEVVVEKLRLGDAIVTIGGQTRRLCWIGHGQTIATRGRRSAATPVIVRKGALSDNVPHLDLHITKGHSLYLDGVLIPVEFLINHRSIQWDDRAQEVSVFHLELDAHDVLIANGVAAESYRDDGNRWLFQNRNEGWDQPPKPPYAPVMTGGALVDAIWQRLLDRAGPRPGVPLTDDPDLHLLVDGQRLDAHEVQGLVRVFRLVWPPASICIASREAVPAELGIARDPRSLGVALRQVTVRAGTKFVAVKANDARLVDGFHAYEAADDLRWTDGNAMLPVEAFARFKGWVDVVLYLAATTRYPHTGQRGGRAAA